MNKRGEGDEVNIIHYAYKIDFPELNFQFHKLNYLGGPPSPIPLFYPLSLPNSALLLFFFNSFLFINRIIYFILIFLF